MKAKVRRNANNMNIVQSQYDNQEYDGEIYLEGEYLLVLYNCYVSTDEIQSIELLTDVLQVKRKRSYNNVLWSIAPDIIMNRSLSIHLYYLGVRYWDSLQYYQNKGLQRSSFSRLGSVQRMDCSLRRKRTHLGRQVILIVVGSLLL